MKVMGLGRTLAHGLVGCAVALVPLVPLAPSPAAAVAVAAPKPIPGWQAGQSWTTEEATPSEVVVSRLPAVTPAELKAPKTVGRPARLVKDAAAYAAAKRTPKGPVGTAIPQKKAASPAPGAPKVPTAPKAPNVSSFFTGISLNQVLVATGQDVEPSDTQMAAGPTALVELVNFTGQVFHKNGTAASSLFRLGSFFGFASTYFPGDPRVVFDPSTQRWYATAMGYTSGGLASQVRLNVSATSNPLGTWYRYLIFNSATVICDQPKLGYSSDKLIIGCTDFNARFSPPNDFVGGVIIAVNKSRVMAGATVLVGHYGPDLTLFGLVPAQNVDTGPRGYVVFNYGLDTSTSKFDAVLITVDGNPQAGFGLANLHGYLIPMSATTIPPNAPQNGATNLIDTGDDRFMSAVLQGGEIWTSGGTGCMPIGDTVVRACMKMLKLGVAGNTVDLDTTSGIVGKYIFYPTLGLDANSNAAIDYSLSSASDYPSHGAMVQRSNAGTPTDRGLVQTGAGPYTAPVPPGSTGSRWGDYAAVATDPVEPTRVWIAGEYSDGTTTFTLSNWNTGIAAIDFTSLNLSVTGIGFGPQLVGSSSAAQTLTVTNTGDASVNILATLADSSQFQAATNTCYLAILAPAATCTATFVFNPTSPGDKVARFNVSAANYGPLPLVLSGSGLDPTCGSTAITTDVASPQYVGATVTLNATAAGCPNASELYAFELRLPGATAFTTVSGFSNSPSFAWDTSTYKPGTYLIAVVVKDALSTKGYDTYAYGTYTLLFPYCTSTNIAPDVLSPQSSGTTVTFTATTSPVCTAPRFEWWLNKTGVWYVVPGFDFAHSTNTFVWNTSGLPNGTYQIGVWARQTGSTRRYDAFAFITYTLVVVSGGTTRCQGVNVTPSPPSPSDAGTTVTLTAAATSCSNPQYRWWVRDRLTEIWHVVAEWTVATSTYSWTAPTPGTYLVGVWVRQTGSLARYEAYSFITYTLTVPPTLQPCTAVNMTPSVPSPQIPGTTVTFTAVAAGCASASYRFFIQAPDGSFVQTQPYGGATFNWNTTGLASGIYELAVLARRTGSAASYEAIAQVSFQIKKNNTPCTLVTLISAPSQFSASEGIGFAPVPTGCTISMFHFLKRHGNTGSFVQVATAAGPLGFDTSTWAGGWWTMQVLAEDPTWPGVYDGIVYTDFFN
jgi:hypothetical protein